MTSFGGNSIQYLDALIMQIQTKRNPPSKHITNLRSISSLLSSTFHPPVLMHDPPFNHTISNGFTRNILCVFFRIQMQLVANVAERDTGVG